MEVPGSPSRTRRILRAVRVGLICALATLAGCAKFDAKSATATETFSDQRVSDLVEAAATGDVTRVESLVKAGADVNAKGRGNVTPLMYCLRQQSKGGYEALLLHKADPNVHDADGSTVVHAAAEESDPFWLRLALENGGKPDVINTGNHHFPNQTPMYYAINAGGLQLKSGRPESVKLLIAAGADLNHKDAAGSNPLRESVLKANYEIALMLLEAGADFRQTDTEQATFVDWIARRNALQKERKGVFEQVIDEEQRPWFQKVVAFLEAKGVDLTPKNRQ